MKLLSLVFLLISVVSVGANDTVEPTKQELESCKNTRAGQQFKGCCTYKDCGWCGFYQRCCYKTGADDAYWHAAYTGECHCGVDDYPQDTCF